MKEHLTRKDFTPGWKKLQVAALTCLLLALMSSCYHKKHPVKIPLLNDSIPTIDTVAYARQLDSIRFARTHHYSENFNFVVKADSVVLLRQQPEEEVNNMPTDSFAVAKDTRMVVADIRMISNDPIDTVWVQLATEHSDFGWVRESHLLDKVDPDDPISQFISVFSNVHTLIFLVVISLIAVGYLMRKLLRRNAKIVHFNDISSFYPMLLAINVAVAATFYASIQLFAPEMWREFYFHPSLNPFTQPLLLCMFLFSVWTMPILAIAAIDDTFHELKADEAFLYLCGLAAVCAFNYILFSISTLYFIGYLFLVLYIYFSTLLYLRSSAHTYTCGKCGSRLNKKGRCPECGAWNE